MRSYLRWMATYAAGLAEGEIVVYTGFHHWAAWPGTVWLILPMLAALAAYSWKD